MDIFAKVIAVNEQQDGYTANDGRQLRIIEVTLSIPEVRSGQANGTPYVEGRLITASLFLNHGEQCTLGKGMHIVANIGISSKFLPEKNRYFNRVNLVKYIDLGSIEWKW